MISMALLELLISADTPHTAKNPKMRDITETTLCSHSLDASSWMSTLTVMHTMASCCSREDGTSVSQLTTRPAERTSDSTPDAVPCRYTENRITPMPSTSAKNACVKSAKSRLRFGGTSSICGLGLLASGE